MQIYVTDQARQQIRNAANDSSAADLALRLAVRQLSDGSFDYGMGFDIPKPGDIIIENQELTIIVANQYQDILNNTILDYVEIYPGDFRFIFQNPNDPQHGIKNQS